MRRCAVIGSPIAHSLSPLLHRTAYACLGIADQLPPDGDIEFVRRTAELLEGVQ